MTMTIGLPHFLVVAAILFTIGVAGIIFNRRNVIVLLMSIELILLATNINFVAFSVHQNNLIGQVFAFIVLTVAARKLRLAWRYWLFSSVIAATSPSAASHR